MGASVPDILVIGGGPAGLALSYHLSQHNIAHLILEAGQIGESWRSRRWDSLRLVAPNWHLQLPGMPYTGANRHGFMHRDEVVEYLETFARATRAPVRTGARVTSLEALPSGVGMRVDSDAGRFRAGQVVVATGAYTAPRIPSCAPKLAARLFQLHALQYRRPAQLPPGAVLVVGSGESGCQIAEELRRAGRDVWLAVGRCSWLPRRYRGRDCIAWITELGGFEQTVDTLPGGDVRQAPPGPQLTGQDGGRDLNLHTLRRDGVRLVGHLEDATGEVVRFASDLGRHIADADAAAIDFCRAVDDYILSHGLDAPPEPPPRPTAIDTTDRPTRELDVVQGGISTVVWATGYRPRFDWVRLPVFDPDGYPIHSRGVTAWPGLYFLGLEWQYTAKSHVLQGIGADAQYLARLIAAYDPDAGGSSGESR